MSATTTTTPISEKPLSASLFAFNNKIVSMKSSIKKCKILVTRKLTRQISVLKNKKGNEKQLAKNQRKVQKLKDEICIIKKLKFNDIAIYCMESELTFNQVIKSKPNIDLNEKSLAVVALHKLIVNEIAKVKESEKDWRKILIQYKARIEKKRSWKEKQKFHKEIEESLLKMQAMEEQNGNKVDEEAVEPVEETKKEAEVVTKKEKSKKIVNGSGDEKIKITENAKEETDTSKDVNKSESESGDDSIIDDDEEEDFGFDNNNDDDDQVSVESEEEEYESEEEVIEENPPPKKVKREKPMFFEDIKTNYKPRTNVSSKEMVIKQIAMDELSDCEEIPIENHNQEFLVKPAKANASANDPFFITSSNGASQPIDTSKARVDDSVADNFDEDGFDDRKFKTFKSLNSTFQSLSSRDYGDRGGGFDRRNNNGYDNSSRPARRSYNNDESSGEFTGRRFDRPPQNSFKRYDNERREGPQNGYNEKPNKRFEAKEKPKPLEDLSKLHPSWRAKIEQEEKLKSLKFQGTKVKFDDD